MTILVDDARWEWRGHRWAHLVSDDSYEELHAFARRLGKRRLGFQGDHYDIVEVDRGRALDLGAEGVDSRVLVRRLRDAGLRNRHNKPTWQTVEEWPSGISVALTSSVLAGAIEAAELQSTDAHVHLLRDPDHLALLLDFSATNEIPPAARPWATDRRADGTWSAEFFLGNSGLTAAPGR